MTDHIGEATKKVIDLDALEKRLKRTKWTRERNDGPNGNYFDEVCDEDDFGAEESLVNPDGPEAVATIKALIAELREASALLTEIAKGEVGPERHGHYLAHRRAVNSARTFLARNGKGEG